MAKELIYTSAERGLRPGTRGFCTVAYTRGMRPQTIQILEGLSVYKNLYAVHDPKITLSPVAVSYYRLALMGRTIDVLSRVSPTQPDHTGRSNKMAHHVVLGSKEHVAGGPAALASQPGFFVESWSGDPRHIEEPKVIPAECAPSDMHAAHWEELVGDAGWAGVLAYTFLGRATSPAFLIFEPGMDILPLIGEALALLPPGKRWQVTFNTYFTSLPTQATCAWRCCVPDAEALREARRNPRVLTIDLTQPLPAPKENPLVRCAREGGPPPQEEPSSSPKEEKSESPSFVLLRNRRVRPSQHRQRPSS
jgi:hypothetical protein